MLALLFRLGFSKNKNQENIYSEPTEKETKDLIAKLENVNNAFDESRAVFGLKDNLGESLDTMKIFQSQGRIFAVSHFFRGGNSPVVKLSEAVDNDLTNWRHMIDLESSASQAYIYEIENNQGFLLSIEKDNSTQDKKASESWIELKYYSSQEDLLNNKVHDTLKISQELSQWAEGTPSILSVKMKNKNIHDSEIIIDGHYFRDHDVDRQMQIKIKNFEEYTHSINNEVNDLVENYFLGNFGDRDYFGDYVIYEGQRIHNRFDTWELTLYNTKAKSFYKLNIKTPDNSKSFANPNISKIKLPNGNDRVIVSIYLPSEGATRNEAGQLLYWF